MWIELEGLANLRDVAMGFCLWQRFSGSGAAFRLHRRRLWVHAATVAAAARYLAGLAKQDTSLAFSAGLLHDIGKLVLGFRLEDRYWSVLEDAARHGQSVASIEREVFTCDHATVGAWLLQKWQLPTALVDAVGMHHDAMDAALAVDLPGIVATANKLVNATDPQSGTVEDEILEQVCTSIPGLLGMRQWQEAYAEIGNGRPDPLDADEPENLAKTIAALKLNYVVITSVDRDDLRDGGAAHFVACIERVRALSPATRIEILTPDFRGRMDRALEILKAAPPDVMNHNLETAPRLYKEARPGSDYQYSLSLLKRFKELHPQTPTKSGIMVGLGETDEEILQVMRDLRAHDVDMLTIGQYLMPSGDHLPVRRYVHPDTFKMFEEEAYKMGFVHAAVGAMVRSSYHADQQAHGAGVS